ncbi:MULTISPECIES: hypothetical protein [Bacillus cereus group]
MSVLNLELDKIVDEAFENHLIEGLVFVGSAASRSLLAQEIMEGSPISGYVFLTNQESAFFLSFFESETAISIGMTADKAVTDNNREVIIKAIEVLTEATRTYQSQVNNHLPIAYSHSIEQWLDFKSNTTLH